jgi:hypothetical protein
MHTKFWLESRKRGDHSEHLGIDLGDNIKIDLKKMGFEGVNLIHLAQDSDR